MRTVKGRIASAVALVALSASVAAAPASAANNTSQEGLVNVALTDTVVQVPVGIAANVCGVSVNALSTATAALPVDCDAIAGATAFRESNGGGNNTKQSGLVNIAVTDTTVQIPIGVAANVCGLSVNVLSSLALAGPVDCDAVAWPSARG